MTSLDLNSFQHGAIVVTLLVVCVVLALYARSVVRRLHRALRMISDNAQQIPSLAKISERHADNVFRQLEALDRIHRELKFEKKPATDARLAGFSPIFLAELTFHALNTRPHVVVECGSGVSTVVLARALQVNGHGHVYSLEHIAEYACKTRQELERHGLEEWATIVDAPIKEQQIAGSPWLWYSAEQLQIRDIDMLIVDGPPEGTQELARYPAGPILFSRLRPGAAVFVDDASREAERLIVQRWCAEFPHLQTEARDCEKGCKVLWNGAKTAPAKTQEVLESTRVR